MILIIRRSRFRVHTYILTPIDFKTHEEILSQLEKAKIIDKDKSPLLSEEELERFIDIYEPCIFECKPCTFDKEILMCIGEFIFCNGIESIYDCLPEYEVMDYLTILEKLNVLKFDDDKFSVICDKATFSSLCNNIPEHYNNSKLFSDDTYINKIKDTSYDELNGYEFEGFCASLLHKNNYNKITITQGSGDHGIDILAEKDGISYAIQCKRYSSNIGNTAVQQAHTGKSLYHKDIAVVFTNQFFTQQAKEEAAVLGVKLWDRNKLNDMIEKS